MRRRLIMGIGFVFVGAVLFRVGGPQTLWAHCQVPCGIYDDNARIHAMLEDAATIKKAMQQITDLGGKPDAQSLNQAVRWITTKEAHASQVIATVSEYFLTQKVKAVVSGAEGYPAYLEKLAVHHRVLVAAMKTKQHVDTAQADKLTDAIEALGKLYSP